MQNVSTKDGLNGEVQVRMTGQAVEALRGAGEEFVSDVFKDAMNCFIFAKKVSVKLEEAIFVIHHFGHKDKVLSEWRQQPCKDKSTGTEDSLI